MQNINIGEKSWTIRKMAYQRVAVFERLNIRDKPGLIDTKVISKIIPTYENSQINLYVSEVTEERETIDGITDRWLRINYNGINGWVFGGYTSVERGGYKYYNKEQPPFLEGAARLCLNAPLSYKGAFRRARRAAIWRRTSVGAGPPGRWRAAVQASGVK